MNQIKLRSVPFLKSLLCWDFFARLVLFAGLCHLARKFALSIKKEKVVLIQEDKSSPNRFSKTFGREKTLDKLLETADDKDLLASLAKDENKMTDEMSRVLIE